MIWIVVAIANVLIILYIIFSLASIKHQLNLISRHLNMNEEAFNKVCDEEIEDELEKF